MNKKINVLTGALFSSLLLVSMNSYADDNSGWYGGVSLGTTTIDTGISGTTGTAVLDESGSGHKFMVGKKLDKNLSIEGFYADFGEASLTGNNGDNFTYNNTTYVFTANNVSIKTSATGLGVNAKFTYDFTSKSSIAGRLGLLMWNTSSSASAGTTAASSSDNGADIFYGLGYIYKINEKYSLTADYDSYTADTDNFTMLSLGAMVNF